MPPGFCQQKQRGLADSIEIRDIYYLRKAEFTKAEGEAVQNFMFSIGILPVSMLYTLYTWSRVI